MHTYKYGVYGSFPLNDVDNDRLWRVWWAEAGSCSTSQHRGNRYAQGQLQYLGSHDSRTKINQDVKYGVDAGMSLKRGGGGEDWNERRTENYGKCKRLIYSLVCELKVQVCLGMNNFYHQYRVGWPIVIIKGNTIHFQMCLCILNSL